MHGRRTLHCLTTLVAAAALAGCGGAARADDGDVVARARPPAERSTADASPSTSRAGGLLVDVAGHVRRPGVYRLEPGARVHEAIAAAGGARPGADLTALNRAAPLVDGQQVLVARAGERAGAGGDGSDDGSGTVSINSADASALDELPGIGPVTAERIVSERETSGPFASIDDLDRVPGVGPATIESLRDVATT